MNVRDQRQRHLVNYLLAAAEQRAQADAPRSAVVPPASRRRAA